MLGRLMELRGKFLRLRMKDGSLVSGPLEISEGEVKILGQKISNLNDIQDIEVVDEVLPAGLTGTIRPWYTL